LGQHKKNNIHLLTFYTEGGDNDLGLNLLDVKNTFEKQAKKHFSSIIISCPRKLIANESKWLNIFKDQREWTKEQIRLTGTNFPWNKNWAALNFLLWKPILIRDILLNNDLIKTGDIIFYHDINIKTYPEYLHGMHKWKDFIHDHMKNKSILLFNDNNMTINKDAKKELIDKYLNNTEDPNKLHHIWAGALAIRKDETGVSFINEWYNICIDKSNRSPVTSYPNEPDFIWHSQEQACLSILYHLNSIKFKDKIKCCFLYGKRSIPVKNINRLKWQIKKFVSH
tara:strand:+ start:3254 stop:4099 length:846 start_codon:yes stop_codon:yes gene_type:complete